MIVFNVENREVIWLSDCIYVDEQIRDEIKGVEELINPFISVLNDEVNIYLGSDSETQVILDQFIAYNIKNTMHLKKDVFITI